MNGDMMTFRPLFWPTFFTIPAIILLISLGSWQLSRLAEKTELIAQFEQRSNAAAIGINQVTEPVEAFGTPGCCEVAPRYTISETQTDELAVALMSRSRRETRFHTSTSD